MRVLLDTHAMYWYIEGDPQLSITAQMLIQDASNEMLVSSASFWEIAIKISIGKWRLDRPFEEFIDIGLNPYRFPTLANPSISHRTVTGPAISSQGSV